LGPAVADHDQDVTAAFEQARASLEDVTAVDTAPVQRFCKRCDALRTAEGDHCPSCGGWLPSNTGHLIHGGRSRQVRAGQLPEQAEAVAALAERHAEIVNELGGADALSIIKRDLVTRYLETAMIADYLASNVWQHGPLTGKGRTRAAVTAYLQVLDRQQKLAATIGIERQAKTIDLARALAEQQR
jgi:hypothetical protein